ncbi:aldehyde dehydrogenase [Microvirga pakistanensis]|uniref:aldehyde dehydrogenase n=1 Tax=Microvirga pakistanensis TaxID=1682650 RepID=UPI0010694C13|nr:aldehyde dehydrogenase [Microvirga pakistanensis]
MRGSGPVLETINPANGEVHAAIGTPSSAEVEAICSDVSHSSALRSWQSMLPHQRAAVLHRIADGLVAGAEPMARAQMLENGKTLKECRAQAASAAGVFRYYAGVCETMESTMPPPRGNWLGLTTHEPYGLIAAITPWNSPLTMESQKVAPALAAGNAVVLKPSEVTTLPALELARICEEAGLPKGLLSVLPGYGTEVGPALIGHPDVRMVTFTGGTETGRRIGEQCARRLIPVALELGGKSPHILFEDADIPTACEGIIDGIFEGLGQSCIAGSRLFVHRSRMEEVLERLTEMTEKLRVGLPTDPNVDFGSLSSHQHRARVEQYVTLAREEGATVLVGGSRPTDPALAAGAFYLPTILTGLSNRSRVCQEEIFGPVLCVLPFDDEADLIDQANGTAFGLACGIWTADYRRGLKVARAIAAGTVWINTYKKLSIAAPFGGYKDSGLGREKGLAGMRLYQQTKSILLATE